MPHPTTEPTRTSLPAFPTTLNDAVATGLAALKDWRPYEPPPAPFPADWRSDVPSWLERICEPENAPTGAWAWEQLALLARHAEGRVALEARAAFLAAVEADEKLRDHLEFHVMCCVHHFEDDVCDGVGLDTLALVRRETAEALAELLEPAGGAQTLLRVYLRDMDRRVCREMLVESESRPAQESTRNAVWRDDHASLLSSVGFSDPLAWWGEGNGYGFRREVLAARALGPKAEARVREGFARR